MSDILSDLRGWHVYWSDGKGSYDKSFSAQETGQAWAFYAERAAECRAISLRESAKQGVRVVMAAYINLVVD